MNHQTYGILLFLLIITLFYLLNRSNKLEKREGFVDGSNEKYHEYQSSYFNDSEPRGDKWKDQTLEQCFKTCDNDKKCLGVSRQVYDSANLKATCYPIYSTKSCKSTHQGSGQERTNARNYNSYIKKTLEDHEHLCLAANNLNRDLSIICTNDLYWLLEDEKMVGYSSTYIEIDERYRQAGFKIVDGLAGDGTVSFEPLNNKYSNHCVVHQYPRKEQLFIMEKSKLKTVNDKARASFRVSQGLNGQGLSIRIIQYPEVYVQFENKKKKGDRLIAVPIEKNRHLYDLATFYFHDVIDKKNISDSVKQMEESDVLVVTPQEKNRKARTKNLHSLEKQKALLESQNQQILNFDFTQANQVNYIGRELAKQASHIELGNYLQEQESFALLQKKLGKTNQTGDNMPSKENFTISSEPRH